MNKLHSSRYSVEDYDQFATKILNSEFRKYLPRPQVLIQETDGYDNDIPLIFRDNYNKNNVLDVKDVKINSIGII